jgi:hypothetical protein
MVNSRKYIKILIYLYVFIGFSIAQAQIFKESSYESFFRAVKRDDGQAVTALIARGFDANTPYTNGDYALTMAIQEQSASVVAALLAWDKLKVEVRNPHDESPLMMAALVGNAAVARQLIARDADINKPGWAPLHYAATNGHTDIMQLLLDGYAYIDASAPNGATPLMMAAEFGNIAAVQLLLDAGADATLKNRLGQTALDYARRGNRPDAIKVLSELAARPHQPAASAPAKP